jgi:hypothetical protein
MSSWPAALEIYDREGMLVRSVRMQRDDLDQTTWLLAESVTLGGPLAETAVIRFNDGTSEPLPPSLFATRAPITTLSVRARP